MVTSKHSKFSQPNGATSKSSSLPWETLASPLAPWPPPSSIEADSHCFATTVPALHHENYICNALTPAAMETTFFITRLFESVEEEGITILAPKRTSSRSCTFARKHETTTLSTTSSRAHNEQTSQICNVPLSALTDLQPSSLRASHQRSAATPPVAVHP